MRGWARSSSESGGRCAGWWTSGLTCPCTSPGETSGPEASRYDPHWWHDPVNAEAAVREIREALIAADPSHRKTLRAKRRRLPGEAPHAGRRDRALLRSVPANRAQAGDRSRRVRLFRRALRDRGRGRRHPFPDDRGAAVGRRDLADWRTRSGASTCGRSSRRARSTRTSREALAQADGRDQPTSTLYGDTLGPDRIRRARPIWRWRRPTPTRWFAGSPAGSGAAGSGLDRASDPTHGHRRSSADGLAVGLRRLTGARAT